MRTVALFLALLTATLLLRPWNSEALGAEEEDLVTKALVAQYFDPHGIRGEYPGDRGALSWILVRRCRRSEGWRPILARAKNGCVRSVHLLGQMLAREAREREAVERWNRALEDGPGDIPPGPRDPVQRSNLRDEVVPVLRVLPLEADSDGRLERHWQEEIALALVRSRHPGLKADCIRILAEERFRREVKFYAAAELARQGVEAGTEWLEKARDNRRRRGRIRFPPDGAASSSIKDCCIRILECPEATYHERLTWRP
jgi:hypothetical protein